MELASPVLVYVEDDPASIVVMRAIVEKVMKWNDSLHVISNSADFIQRVQQLVVVPDLFLFDIQMAPYNGFDLLSMIRNDPGLKNTKVVALTASVMSEEIARLKQRGFDGAIAKPLDIDVFPDLITNILRGERIWYIV
jgi:CheY-like chemotaxis protein